MEWAIAISRENHDNLGESRAYFTFAMQAKAAQSNDIALESVKKANKTVIRYINHSRLSINNAYDYPFISPYVYQSAVCYLETGKMIDNLEKE